MSKKKKSKFLWIWPGAGPAPTTETSIKSQSFSILSYLIYIVREAVQNTTDAWNFLFFGKSEKAKRGLKFLPKKRNRLSTCKG